MEQEAADVVATLEERWDLDLVTRQPMQQGGSERALAEASAEVPVCRRDQPDVDRDLIGRPDALDRCVLQRAQQHGLHLDRDLADLVEEQRAPGGPLEVSAVAVEGPGEGPPLMAEELRGRDARLDRGHVDGDPRLVGAPARPVDRVRDQLLAGAGLSAEQHRHRERGHPRDVAAKPAHGCAVTDEPVIGEVVREAGLELVEQQHHTLAELEHRALDEAGAGNNRATGDRGPVDDHRAARRRLDGDAAVLELEPRRASREERVEERPTGPLARKSERRRRTGQLAALEGGGLPDPFRVEVMEDREAGLSAARSQRGKGHGVAGVLVEPVCTKCQHSLVILTLERPSFFWWEGAPAFVVH